MLWAGSAWVARDLLSRSSCTSALSTLVRDHTSNDLQLPAKYCFIRILKDTKHLSSNTPTHWMVWIGCTATMAIISYIIASAIPVFGGLVSVRSPQHQSRTNANIFLAHRCSPGNFTLLPTHGLHVALRQLEPREIAEKPAVETHGRLECIRDRLWYFPDGCRNLRVDRRDY